MKRLVLAAVVGLAAGVAVSACMVEREGAPCDRDENCPRSQYCDLTNTCVELRPTLEAATACQLMLVTLSQKFSDCASGRPQDWLEFFLPDQICPTLTGDVTAGRLTYDPMKLKVCRAALLADECADLSVRKPGRMIADCPMLAPAVTGGGACRTDQDCASGWCDTTAGCPGACKAFIAEGGACGATNVCAPETTCNGGTCKRLSTSGACTGPDAGLCESFDHYCNGSGQCVPREPAGTAGCQYTGNGNFCQSNLNCVGPAFGGTRSCLKGGALDQPCTPNTNSCDKFTYCQTRDGGANLCTLIPKVGEGCGLTPPQGAQDLVILCRQSRCNGFTCVTYTPVGQSCNGDAECGPLGRCIGGACRAEFCQ